MLTRLLVVISLSNIGVDCTVWEHQFNNYSLEQFTLNDTCSGEHDHGQIDCHSALNVQLHRGALNLITRYESDGKVSSGWAETNEYFPFKVIEIRAALPKSKGSLLRPTIQLIPRHIYGYPRDGQIDFLVYNQSHLFHGVHADFRYIKPYQHYKHLPDDPEPAPVYVEQFNVYRLTRRDDKVEFKINENIVHTFFTVQVQYKDQYNPFEVEFEYKLVMNVGVGDPIGNFSYFSQANRNVTRYDAINWNCSSMIIDYIKIINQDEQDMGENKPGESKGPAVDLCGRVMTATKPVLKEIPYEAFGWYHGLLIILALFVILLQVLCVMALKNVKNNAQLGCHIKKKNLELAEKKLNEGFFGEVYPAVWNQTIYICYGKRENVAVKLPKNSDEDTIASFMREAVVMRRFKHNNVLEVYGVCLEEERPMVVMPFMANGDLLSFIKKERIVTLTTDQLETFARQIAQGMEYLAQRNYIHRDLAARNCMLDKNLVIKVSDFGLTKHLYDKKYYKGQRDIPLPYRWMAIECIEQDKFAQASDVWSYGITLWEIFTAGDRFPYKHMTDREMVRALNSGYRLEQSDGFPDHIYLLAFWCWLKDPAQRPEFAQIVSYLVYKNYSSLQLEELIIQPINGETVSGGVAGNYIELANM